MKRCYHCGEDELRCTCDRPPRHNHFYGAKYCPRCRLVARETGADRPGLLPTRGRVS